MFTNAQFNTTEIKLKADIESEYESYKTDMAQSKKPQAFFINALQFRLIHVYAR